MASKYKEFKQGIFKPKNKEKCQNKNEIIYRSALEMKFMRSLDENPNILEWGSENHIIPYLKPGPVPKIARYFIDIYFKIKINEEVKEFLVEIKPEKQTKLPTKRNNKKLGTVIYENITFAINQSKWKAAQEYAAKKNMTFLIVTEKNIDQITQKR